MRHYAYYTLLLLPSLIMAAEGQTETTGTEMMQDISPSSEQQAMAIEPAGAPPADPAGEQPADPADQTTEKATQKRKNRKHRKHRKHCKAAKKSCKHHRKSVRPATVQIKELWNVRYNTNCAMPQVVTPVCAPSCAPAA